VLSQVAAALLAAGAAVDARSTSGQTPLHSAAVHGAAAAAETGVLQVTASVTALTVTMPATE